MKYELVCQYHLNSVFMFIIGAELVEKRLMFSIAQRFSLNLYCFVLCNALFCVRV